jgi:hypothetical protein
LSTSLAFKITKKQTTDLLWTRGNLAFKYHDGQKVIDAAYRSVTGKLFVCNIARRFGKTYWAVTKALEVAIKTENARVVIASAFQKDVAQFIVPTFKTILKDCPKSLKPNFNATSKKYEFSNGSEILICGLDKNPDAGRGNYCDLYIYEEAAFVGEDQIQYTFDSVVMPMTMNRPNAKIIMISTPPRSPSHPFKSFCDRASNQNAYVKLTIYDNPMVSPETIEEYKAECLNVSDWEREYMASFVVDTNSAVIPEWKDEFVQDTSKDGLYPIWHRYTSMDMGTRDLTAMIYAYYDFQTGKIVIEDETDINGPEMTTPIVAQLVKDREERLWGKTKVYKRIADSNNPQMLQDMSILHQLYFQPTNKDTLSAMVNQVRIMVQAGRIIVHPRCLKLIGCLNSAVYSNADRNMFSRSKEFGHFDHLAALIYLVRNVDQATNPLSAIHGMSPFTHHINPQTNENSANARVIKNIFKR